MNIVALLIVGVAAGFLATRLMRLEADILTTVAIGIGGALIGTVLIRVLLQITGWLGGFVGALLGTLLLIWIWKTWIKGR